ncbi:putative GTP-binding protein 10 [Daphnia magna]|uniref:Putative GTP-binding protein 10 n=1 Tax=Daphnia magna TaxID=35525 RepID=A0A0P6FKG6_9CRUS|nr:putative GTP-binding protein 10 [Daphnia magna]
MVFCTVLRFCSKKTRGKSTGKFIDSLRLMVRGGPGGMGHPKYGGVGGRGGNVILVADEEMTLNKVLHKVPARLVKAGEGENSHAHRLCGDNGADFILPVPTGISVFSTTGVKFGDLNKADEQVIVAKGGLGGQPATQFNGLKGEEIKVVLDLKLIADIGLVGFPNAGKSSLLKSISRAKPRVAAYPFTTLKPQLGVIMYDDFRQITMADLPGLIEGAHQNRGLGHRFLKHIERTKLLIFLVDINGFQLSHEYPLRQPFETVALLNKELELYGKEILSKPTLLVVNKMDTEGAEEKWKKLKDLLSNYKENIRLLPKVMQPQQPITFDEIWNMSVQQDPEAVRTLAFKLRQHLDIHADYERSQLPIQQIEDGIKDMKQRHQIQNALTEHSSSKLM